MSTSSPSDPAGLINKSIKIQNLLSKPELNDQLGLVTSYLNDRNRYTVQLYSVSPTTSPISLKADNLNSELSTKEKIFGQMTQMKTMAITFMKDERVRSELLSMYNNVQSKLPNGVKVEYVALGLLLGFIYFVMKFGVTKTLMIASILGIFIVVSLPDIISLVNNNNAYTSSNRSVGDIVKVLVRNFPSRWRNMIHEQSGYNMNPKVANGLLVVFLLVTGKVLFVPSSSSKVTSPNLTQTELELMKQQQYQEVGVGGLGSDGSLSSTSLSAWTLEDIYSMGFNDANSEKEHGTSLPENHDKFYITNTLTTTSPAKRMSQTNMKEFDYPYDSSSSSSYPYTPPPPVPPKKNNIGFGTLFSLFGLFRTVKELGFVDGSFDFRLLQHNVKHMPPLKMALTAFLVYRVVKSFI
mmetsp:Transcript_21291/g.24204  ORF Transcript_21291/g.24204 Transcript_21291/m.24204 type:complete len:409 (+) Transcript_21291:211-1437(+)